MKLKQSQDEVQLGPIRAFDRTIEVSQEKWTPHPAYEGVFLKHLLKGEGAENRLSIHLVRVDPGRSLEPHAHPDQLELHEVVQGEGCGLRNGERIEYKPGLVAVMPSGAKHSVRAGEKGLLMFAKFIPPLL